MANGCGKTNENIYFRCRKEAAKYDERLSSREGASELLGISVSSLSDYELGNTKVVPVDKVDLMAALYLILTGLTLVEEPKISVRRWVSGTTSKSRYERRWINENRSPHLY